MINTPENKKPYLLKCEHISKSYEDVAILSDIDFMVRPGEFVSIVGPSGCGKTTLLRIIRGFITPDHGNIIYNSDAIADRSEIGFIFQGTNLLPWRTVAENIRLPLELQRIDQSDMHAEVDRVLELTGLTTAAARYPHQLSGGMKQLAALGKALVDEDTLILMDEPFASLDPSTREDMALKVHRLWKETKSTIIFVTHFLDEAVFLSDKVIVLSSQPTEIKYIADTSSYNGGEYNSFRYPISATINSVMEQNGHAHQFVNNQLTTDQQKTTPHRIPLAYLFSPIIALLIVATWQLFVSNQVYPEFILPAPLNVWERFIAALSNHLIMHVGVTTLEAILGFLLGTFVGVLIGYPLAKMPFLEKIFYPYITASQTTPIIAIAPLLALWFGFGITSKFIVAALIVFFPVLITTITSLRQVSNELSEIMQELNATRWQTMLKLEIPGALPYIFATMKVAITLSLVGAVVGEFVSSNTGLGYLVIASKGVLDVPLLFVTIFMLALVGITLYSFVLILEKVVFRSKTDYMKSS